jgi:hypothetical protein
MIFTTNKPLGAWGRVLHDPDLAEAILDRVLERGRHFELRGPSYRTRHLKLDLHHDLRPPSAVPTRLSGNHRPEFPEPTASYAVCDYLSLLDKRRKALHVFLSRQRGQTKPQRDRTIEGKDRLPDHSAKPTK